MSDPIVDRFVAFVVAERARYDGADNNRVAFSLGQMGRYLRFVEIVKTRYDTVNAEVVERFRRHISAVASQAGVRELTPEEVTELDKEAQLQVVLHFEIESFFLFAKILLDKIAQFIEDFFGTTRGASLRSHDKWCKAIDTYAQDRQLIKPAGIDETIHRLRSLVADYRDKQIAHFQNPRALFATLITAEGSTQVGTSPLYPKEGDKPINSPTVDEASALIEAYMRQIVELIESNRIKTRYKLRSEDVSG
jgi:hypothetical protein